MKPARVLAVSVVALGLVTTGIVLDGARAAATGTLSLVAKGASGTTVTGAGQFTMTGDSTVRISVSHLSAGNATLAAGPGGGLTSAVQFPRYVASGTYPRAVVRLDAVSGSAFNPGTADFRYGAVFRLDATSSGRSSDNGDNAFQRGLSGEPSMFKLELDGGHPACTVVGASGRVYVRSTTAVTRGQWYTATCSRVAGKLTVATTPYSTGTVAKTAGTASVSGSTGKLAFSSSRPASIGGKLLGSGAIDSSATDQFNGAIAKVWVERL